MENRETTNTCEIIEINDAYPEALIEVFRQEYLKSVTEPKLEDFCFFIRTKNPVFFSYIKGMSVKVLLKQSRNP